MLDIGPPPAALYEKAPSGLFLPKISEKLAILPGMTPYPGLFGGADTYGATQVPPWTPPTAQIALWNAVATSGVPVAATGTPVLTEYSEIFVWAATRTGPASDPNPISHVVTDNQGGTYTKVGAEQKFNNSPTTNSITCQLWKRDQRVPAGGLPATTFNMTVTTITATPWATGLVFEFLNPGNYPLQYAVKNQQVLTASGNHVMPDSGDLFVIDFLAGGSASSTISGNSGMTQIYNSATFVSSNLRHTVLTSGLRASAAGRTYSTVNGGAVTSLAVYFDGPQRSKAVLTRDSVGVSTRVGPTASTGTTFAAVPIGAPAPDRIVAVSALLVTGNGTLTSFATNPTSVLPWLNVLPGSGGTQCGQYLWIGLVPTGTTMDITVVHTSGQTQIYVQSFYGASMLGVNQRGMVSGDTTPRLVEAASQNAPQNLTGVFVPRGALLIGASNSRANTTSLVGSWTQEAQQVVTTAGSVAGCVDNIAGGADLSGLTLGSTFAGAVAMSHGYAVFGP